MDKEIKQELDRLIEVSSRMRFADLGLNITMLILIVYLIGYNIWQDRHIDRLETQIQLAQQ